MITEHLLKKRKNSKCKETEDSRFKISQNKLYKACFQHDMTYGGLKDLSRRTVSDKVLRDKGLNIIWWISMSSSFNGL